MKFRVWRTVTLEQWTTIEADTAGEAMTQCEDNQQHMEWHDSSISDSVIQDIEEGRE